MRRHLPTGDDAFPRIVLRTTYAALLEAGEWRPIPGCPGRCVLPGPREASPAELVGARVRVHECESPQAVDPVSVARFEGGGLISFRKPDGRYVHTLNTPEGLARKLDQLGLRLPEDEAPEG